MQIGLSIIITSSSPAIRYCVGSRTRVIGKQLADCETIFGKFNGLEFTRNLGEISMPCLISAPNSSPAYNFKYFCPVISDSPKSDRLRYLAGKSFNKIFTTFHAREEAQIEYFANARDNFLSNQMQILCW